MSLTVGDDDGQKLDWIVDEADGFPAGGSVLVLQSVVKVTEPAAPGDCKMVSVVQTVVHVAEF